MSHRLNATFLYLFVPLLALIPAAHGRDGSRFEEAKKLALQYIDSDQFDRAAGKLEEIREQDKTDPVVAENLAIAYLNGDDRRYHPEAADKALQMMEEAIKLGGKATFLVQHKHEGKLERLATGGDSLRYCDGKLVIEKGKVRFIMKPLRGSKEDHSFEAPSAQLRYSGRDNASTFSISHEVDNDKGKPTWKKYTMEQRNGRMEDNKLILALIGEHAGGERQ